MASRTRICSTCQSELPLTKEYFYADARYQGGFRRQCKKCIRNVQREWERNNPDKIREKIARRDKAKDAARTRRWRQNNPETVKEVTQRYRARNAEAVREQQRRWREDNPDYQREYYQRNLERKRAYSRVKRREYRARKRDAEGSHTVEDVRIILERQQGRCWWCQEPVGDEYHVDHRIPLARGGSDSAANLVISCPFCNQSKKDKMPHEWIGRLL